MWFLPLIFIGAIVLLKYSDLATGQTMLDRMEIRSAVLRHTTGTGIDPRVVMGIIWRESRGSPTNYVGDTTLPGGPSVGPIQVYFATATALGLFKGTKEQYLAQAKDESQGIAWGVAVLKEKLRIAKGNVPEAIKRYNGSGSSAEKYRDGVLEFLKQTYGMVLT